VKIVELNFVIFVRNVDVIATVKKSTNYSVFLGYPYNIVIGMKLIQLCRVLEEALDCRDKINGWDVLSDARRRTKSDYSKPGYCPYGRRK